SRLNMWEGGLGSLVRAKSRAVGGKCGFRPGNVKGAQGRTLSAPGPPRQSICASDTIKLDGLVGRVESSRPAFCLEQPLPRPLPEAERGDHDRSWPAAPTVHTQQCGDRSELIAPLRF